MPKVKTVRRANTRSTRSARRSLPRNAPQPESPEQRELREQHERLQFLEQANEIIPSSIPDAQVAGGSFVTDSMISNTDPHMDDVDAYGEVNLDFDGGMTLANLTDGGPVGGAPDGLDGFHFPETQSTALAAAASAAIQAGNLPDWAAPAPASPQVCISQGRTAGQVAFVFFGREIRIDSALCKKLAAEAAKRDPILRRLGAKLNMERRGNVEAFLGYLTGIPVKRACKNCHKGHGPWTECIIVEGQLCGSCTNCWFNASGSRCTFHESNQPAVNYASSPKVVMQAPMPKALPAPPQRTSTQQSSSLALASSFRRENSSFRQETSFNGTLQPAQQPSPPTLPLPTRLDLSN